MADFMKTAPPPRTPLGKHRILSSTAGIRVSPLILGGMSIGEKWPFMAMSKTDAFTLLDAFYDAGGNFIDTANAYHDGQSEEWIGEWAAARGIRNNLVISTKYSFQYRAPTNDDKTPAVNNYWGNSKKSMILSLEDSLQKLQTTYIDVFYVHWWDFTTSIPEVMNSLHQLVLQGKVLYLGISDTPAWVVATANTWAIDNAKTPFSIIQGQWNAAERSLEREILPMATHFGMAIAPWDCLGSGRFLTKAQIAEKKKAGEAPRMGWDSVDESTSTRLDEVASARGVSIQAICIAYLRAKSMLVIPLVGGRKVEHLKDNISALDVVLNKEEVAKLDGDFDIGFPAGFVGQDYHVTGVAGQMLKAQGIVNI